MDVQSSKSRREQEIVRAAGEITDSLRRTSMGFAVGQPLAGQRQRINWQIQVLTREEESFDELYFFAFAIMSIAAFILWKS